MTHRTLPLLVACLTSLGLAASPAMADLQMEIEAELKRQEDLLRSHDQDKQMELALKAAAISQKELAERANPRIAPRAPVDRTYPIALFDSEDVAIPPGTWGNATTLSVVKRSIDADRDGKPEEIRYFDRASGQLIRKEVDRNYDGTLDTWQSYKGGAVHVRIIDTNDDGRPDVWETYRSGRMAERQIDRNSDGGKDAFYKFRGESLVEERHDRNDDGQIDLIVTYRNREKAEQQEDRSDNGRIDTWTSFRTVGIEELPFRVERDSDDTGKVNVIEVFEVSSGKPILSLREEDKNDDGVMDVKSIYKNGKLQRREISDPSLVPM